MTWEDYFNLLKEYLKEHNNEYPKTNETYKNQNLGSWISRQRLVYNNGEKQQDGSMRYNANTLSKEQINMLFSINFQWQTNRDHNAFDEKFNMLKEYIEKHNGQYPKTNEKYKGFNIDKWIRTLRLVYNNGKTLEDGKKKYKGCILTPDRIERLNSLNFVWDKNLNEIWDKKYELLKQYLKEHNGKFPSVKEEYKNQNLGSWVSRQRLIYNSGEKQQDGSIVSKKGYLDKNQLEKLKSINFKWQSDYYDNNWEENFELLKEYLQTHDGKHPKELEQYKGVNIGRWAKTLQMVYKHGIIQADGSVVYNSGVILTPERVAMLNSINFKLDANIWENNFYLLVDYMKEHNGKYPPSSAVYKGFYLGRWLNRVNTIYKKGEKQENGSIVYKKGNYNLILEKKIIDLFNSIDYDWNNSVYDTQWNEKYELLKEYLKEKNGKYPVEKEKYHDVNIGYWVRRQRETLKKGEPYKKDSLRYGNVILTKEKIKKLEDINFKWIADENKYYKNEIESKEDLEKKKRYLLLKLNRLLLLQKAEIDSKEAINKINEEYMKILN